MKRMNIAIFPDEAYVTNKYINRMKEAIKIAYPDAIITPFPKLRHIINIRHCDYVWLNWFENLPQKDKLKFFIRKQFILLLIKMSKATLITTFHNRMPHDSSNSLWDKKMFKQVLTLANYILILSSESNKILEEKYGKNILKKTVLVPHPTYDCIPKKSLNNNDSFKILFFGHLRPYKNIEMIFELAQIHPDISFTIAGSLYDKNYELDLKRRAELIPNINLITHFLTTEEIDSLIESNSILLLPYNTKSSLNSGVVIHGICKKINMIVPEIGTVRQLRNKDMIFSYSYDTNENHFIEVNRMIDYAKDEYQNNFEKFRHRIETLYDEVIIHQSPKALSKNIKELFK